MAGASGFSSGGLPPSKRGSADKHVDAPDPSPLKPVIVTPAQLNVTSSSSSPQFFAATTMRVPGRMPGDEFFKSAVIAAGIPVAAMDPTGLINTWNAAAVRLFGRSEADMLGRPLETAIPSDFRAIANRALQRTLQQRSVNTYEITFLPVGGKSLSHVEITLSAVTDGRGDVRGVIAWMRDVTAHKQVETNLSRTSHMASLGTLAAGVAHQFNNIVCGMTAMVDFALQTEDPSAMIRALKMSAEAASRINYITQSLMACTAQDNACGGGPEMADLAKELARFADAVSPSLRPKGIKLELDLQATRSTNVPKARVGQMLQHLLRNAEEAFSQASKRERKITIRTLSQGDTIMLEFADTGEGIDADQLAQIFDPFFTTKSVHVGGTSGNPGLGLTIVHGVVIDMGGHVWADSTPGRGTTIHVMIPVVA